jgi:hypothetical protein
MKSRWLIAVLAVCIGMPTLAQVAVTRNCGPMPRLSFAVTNGAQSVSTTSDTFVNLPPLSVTFSIPGTVNSCLKVELAADTFSMFEPIVARILLDGTTELLPDEPPTGEVLQIGFAKAHSINFYAYGVAPGTHTVTAQWKTINGDTGFAHWRSIGVHHK